MSNQMRRESEAMAKVKLASKAQAFFFWSLL